ncbi:MAG: 16S rRNA (guanine(527)-N(7))-methyltransferase RsmG, partial [Alphaproteobacteria bacterium]
MQDLGARAPDDFGRRIDVSRETLAKLELLVGQIRAWQDRVNLVGRSTLNDIWERHIFDSAQLYTLVPEGARILVDLGSGAGFPGLVLAVMGVPDVHLVEPDRRKAAFLRHTVARLGIPVTLHAARAQDVQPFTADVVTARALAPLRRLLQLAEPFVGGGTVCLFPKGRRLDDELTD